MARSVRYPPRSQIARAVAAIVREIRKGNGALVGALAGVASELEALRLEVAALRARRPSVRPPSGIK